MPDPSLQPAAPADRLLFCAAAAVWLAVIGASVTAGVAVVQRANPATTGDDGAVPYLLYAVIGISAAVILAAIPLLLRARRASLTDDDRPAPPPRVVEANLGGAILTGDLGAGGGRRATAPAAGAPTSRADMLRGGGPVDLLWLRFAAALGGGIGLALLAVAVATYLLAAGSDTAAWVCLGVAAAVTLALPFLPPVYLRQFRALGDDLVAT